MIYFRKEIEVSRELAFKHKSYLLNGLRMRAVLFFSPRRSEGVAAVTIRAPVS
jgi:hypothetical protein